MPKIKVIIHGGIVCDILTDSASALDVEVVDIDKDYEDYNALCKYEDELYADKSLKPVSFTSAHFGEDDN